MVDMNLRSEDTVSLTCICRFCSSILREPVQLKCGHRYCQSCVNNQKEPIIQCLQCKEKTPKNQIVLVQDFKHDKERLNVSCCRCDWTGIWKDYQDHSNKHQSNVICDCCDEKLNSTIELDQHKESFCQNMMIYCKLLPYGCNEQFLRKNLSKHYLSEKHQHILTNCINQSNFNISQKEIFNERTVKSQIFTQLQQLNDQIIQLSKNYQTLSNQVKNMIDLTAIEIPMQKKNNTETNSSIKLNNNSTKPMFQ